MVLPQSGNSCVLEKMAKLDAYTRSVYSKKLFRSHLTYDTLQAIFENCCSFMDFYEALQDRGIDRKTAKHFACQFGGMGLRNQGTEPYCNLPKSSVTEELDYSVDMDLLVSKEDTKRPPNVSPAPNVDDPTIFDSVENWEPELDECRSFTFTSPKPVLQLSLTVDDFVSNAPAKKLHPPVHQEIYLSPKKNGKRIGKHFDGNKGGTTTTAESGTTAKVSKNMTDPGDVFTVGTSSLQVGEFHDKNERYNLEKEVLSKMTKDYKENNSEKGAKDTNVEDSPKSKQILRAESATPSYSEVLRNAKMPDRRSEKSVEKTRKESVNEKDHAALQAEKKITNSKKAVYKRSNDVTKSAVHPGHTGSNECTALVHEENIEKQATRIPLNEKKDTVKLRRSKENPDPVVFVCRKSIEKKQKDWPTVELFAGDIPINVPVDPTLNSEPDSPPENVIQECLDDKRHVSSEKDAYQDPLDTQPAEQSNKSDKELKSQKIHIITQENPSESSNEDETRLSVEPGKIERTEQAVSDSISEETNVTSSAEQQENTKIALIDAAQQTDFDWYRVKERKKLIDKEVQTDCALLSTFNIETLTGVKMQDKETLTDHSVYRRKQSTDTISSYGDNLSDYCGASPWSPLYKSGTQYDINAEVFNLEPQENNHYREEVSPCEIPSPERNQYDPFHFSYNNRQFPRADVYPQPLFNFPPCPVAPAPFYAVNPMNIPAPPLFHPQFHQQYCQGLPGNTSNGLQHRYPGP